MPQATLSSGAADARSSPTRTRCCSAIRASTASRPATRSTPATSSSPPPSATACRCSRPCSARRAKPTRDAETERLLDYGFSLYEREDAGRATGEEEAERRGSLRGRAACPGRYRATSSSARADQKVSVEADGPGARSRARSTAGERLGQATVTVDGRFVDRVPAGRRDGGGRADDRRPDRRARWSPR